MRVDTYQVYSVRECRTDRIFGVLIPSVSSPNTLIPEYPINLIPQYADRSEGL